MKNAILKKFPGFCATQENPCIFHGPQNNSFWPKFQTQKNPSEPPPPPPISKICEWGPWGNNDNLHQNHIYLCQSWNTSSDVHYMNI